MGKIRVLFVCVHNSGRSQIAETFLNSLAGDRFEAESAGLEPIALNPLVIEVMKEAGYDLSKNRADSVFAFFKSLPPPEVFGPCRSFPREDPCPFGPYARKPRASDKTRQARERADISG
jgi:hypothetical protein